MIKNKFKRISIIGALAVLLAGGLGFGVVRMIAPLPVFADTTATQTTTQAENQTVTSDTDNIQDESLNVQDDPRKLMELQRLMNLQVKKSRARICLVADMRI